MSSRRAGAALAALVLAFAVLTALVRAGSLTGVDQFGLDHLMPGLHPVRHAVVHWQGLYQPFTSGTAWWAKVLELWTYPCSVLVSGLVVTAAGAVEWRRGHGILAFAPAGAWVTGNAIEVIGKHLITRPALYGSVHGVPVHVGAYDSSFPSGHTIRCVIVAWALVLVWRRGLRWVALWAVVVGPVLVVTAAHTVTDVVGGALVGPFVVLLATGAAGLLEP